MELQAATPEQIASEQVTANKQALAAKEQAELATIDNDEKLAMAGDLMKAITQGKKRVEDARTALVKPLNDHVRFINSQFKPITEMFEAAAKVLRDKQTKYLQVKRDEERKRADEARRKAEQEAIERAAELEKNGQQEEAEAVVDAAVAMPTAPAPSTPVHGNFGTVSTRNELHVEVVDITKIPPHYILYSAVGEDIVVPVKRLCLLELDCAKVREDFKNGIDIPGLKMGNVEVANNR